MRRGLPITIDPKKDPYSLYEGVEYTQFWNGQQKCDLDALEHIIVRGLLPVSGFRIIDVGCGFGRLADCYMDRFQQVIMVDGSTSLLHQAMEKTGGQAIYVAGDALHLPFRKAAFDSALLIRVFHHIENSQACLAELYRVMCNDGRFIFNYMNKQNALRIMRWLIGVNKENPFDTETVGRGSTFISHHPKAVSEMLYEAGFVNAQFFGAGVLDRLASRMGIADHWTRLGEYLAPFLGKSRLAPWILCSAEVNGNSALIDAGEIRDLFQCPSCGGNLSEKDDGFSCFGCERWYPMEDGIFDFRIR